MSSNTNVGVRRSPRLKAKEEALNEIKDKVNSGKYNVTPERASVKLGNSNITLYVDRSTETSDKVSDKILDLTTYITPIEEPLPQRISTNMTTTVINPIQEQSVERKYKEPITPTGQCNAVIGKFNPKEMTLCWLCGFPIDKLNEILPNNSYSQFLNQNVCEHVLPINIAYAVTGLVGLTEGNNQILLYPEYENAHHYCNYVKNDIHFLTLGYNETNSFCSLKVNSQKVFDFLFMLYGGIRKAKSDPKHNSVIQTNVYNYDNLVQYYVNNNRWQIKDIFGNVIQNNDKLTAPIQWVFSQYWRICLRSIALINYIRLFDNCIRLENNTFKTVDNGGGELYRKAMATVKSVPELANRQQIKKQIKDLQTQKQDVPANLLQAAKKPQVFPYKMKPIRSLYNVVFYDTPITFKGGASENSESDVITDEVVYTNIEPPRKLVSSTYDEEATMIYTTPKALMGSENLINDENIKSTIDPYINSFTNTEINTLKNLQKGGRRTYRKRNKRRITRKQRV